MCVCTVRMSAWTDVLHMLAVCIGGGHSGSCWACSGEGAWSTGRQFHAVYVLRMAGDGGKLQGM